ncbi:MAG: histone deacetylase family protein [Burkholderiaceae bacterium]|nr:histone deacetylase family protein [Burkholderiaceae bacterium]
MKVYFSDRHVGHDPSFFLVRGERQPSAEQPARADVLLDAVRRAGLVVEGPGDFGIGPIAAIHTPEYLEFLQTANHEWRKLPGASTEVIPNIHPGRRPATYPAGIVGRAGWHQADTACPIGENTWDAAYHGAQVALTAADAVLGGAGEAYALCRPPGHHAFSDMAGGFCFLNNTAIAAQHLRGRHERVAILDVDVHHGNGTQGVFYRRADVLTISIHANPDHYYPYFWGHAQERGEGPGEGFNLNLPLALGSEDVHWHAAAQRAFERIAAFGPTALVVALGLDASESDPLQGLRVTTEGFTTMARRIGALGLPTVLVQEGGYLGPALGENLGAFITGFEAGRLGG